MTNSIKNSKIVRILVVDDDEDLRGVIVRMIEKLDQVHIITAHSGNEAIRIVEAQGTFDMIVSDINMHDGSGIDLQHYLVKSNTKAILLFYTGEREVNPHPEHQFYLGVVKKPQLENLNTQIKFEIGKLTEFKKLKNAGAE